MFYFELNPLGLSLALGLTGKKHTISFSFVVFFFQQNINLLKGIGKREGRVALSVESGVVYLTDRLIPT